MKKILLINFRRYGDIFASSVLLDSLYAKYPQAQISYLVFSEMKAAAAILKNIDQIYTIDRKKILTISKCNFMPEPHAIENLHQELAEVATQNWDEVINYSNDKVAAYITSYLTQKDHSSFAGVKFSDSNTLSYSNEWAIIYNDLLPDYKIGSLNFTDCLNQLCGTKIPNIKRDRVKVNSNNSAMAKENFCKIKAKYPHPEQTKIIGIQLFTSSTTKNIPSATITDLLQQMIDIGSMIPILLVAPSETEKEYANKLCAQFDNSIVIVETDFKALPSVLLNLDLLITPDTSIKHLADIMYIPLIEVALGEAPFLKQGTRNSASLILTQGLSKKDHYNKESAKTLANNLSLQGSDIFKTMRYMFSEMPLADISLSENIALYKPISDDLGMVHQLIAGSGSRRLEILRSLSRQYISILFDKEFSVPSYFIEMLSKNTNRIINDEKNAVTTISKDILGCLRCLHDYKTNTEKIDKLIFSIDKIFTHCQRENLIAIAAIIFRSKLEATENNATDQNLIEIESGLYEMKSDIQKLFHLLMDTDHLISKNERIHHLGENISIVN